MIKKKTNDIQGNSWKPKHLKLKPKKKKNDQKGLLHITTYAFSNYTNKYQNTKNIYM